MYPVDQFPADISLEDQKYLPNKMHQIEGKLSASTEGLIIYTNLSSKCGQ